MCTEHRRLRPCSASVAGLGCVEPTWTKLSGVDEFGGLVFLRLGGGAAAAGGLPQAIAVAVHGQGRPWPTRLGCHWGKRLRRWFDACVTRRDLGHWITHSAVIRSGQGGSPFWVCGGPLAPAAMGAVIGVMVIFAVAWGIRWVGGALDSSDSRWGLTQPRLKSWDG